MKIGLDPKLVKLQEELKSIKETKETIKTMGKHVSINSMVKINDYAMSKGRIIHCNEIFVHLGQGYYMYRTGDQAIEILKRRELKIQEDINEIESEGLFEIQEFSDDVMDEHYEKYRKSIIKNRSSNSS